MKHDKDAHKWLGTLDVKQHQYHVNMVQRTQRFLKYIFD